MKNLQKLSYVALGAVLSVAIMGTALAASGAFTITVNPIKVQVNGQTFAPKDAKGNSVPVFEYGGTTYAPLRALAEAYGLEVGYDAVNKIATVGETGGTAPDEPAYTSSWSAENEVNYQKFAAMWDIAEMSPDDSNYTNVSEESRTLFVWYKATYNGTLSKEEFVAACKNIDPSSSGTQMAYKRHLLNGKKGAKIEFYYDDKYIGSSSGSEIFTFFSHMKISDLIYS